MVGVLGSWPAFHVCLAELAAGSCACGRVGASLCLDRTSEASSRGETAKACSRAASRVPDLAASASPNCSLERMSDVLPSPGLSGPLMTVLSRADPCIGETVLFSCTSTAKSVGSSAGGVGCCAAHGVVGGVGRLSSSPSGSASSSERGAPNSILPANLGNADSSFGTGVPRSAVNMPLEDAGAALHGRSSLLLCAWSVEVLSTRRPRAGAVGGLGFDFLPSTALWLLEST
mmetsp:Transcript_9020/g.16302  ORF Transcript_9020/g.16302 Transcript_9020/m.16302 type:complete len:231 (+) Transcript_9020:154-846(+)